jgi:integrase/recombinase XerD
MGVKLIVFVTQGQLFGPSRTSDDIIKIYNEYILRGGYSRSFQNQMISAVKKVYGHNCLIAIDPCKVTRPAPGYSLPNVLSKEEVKKLLNSLTNEKNTEYQESLR